MSVTTEFQPRPSLLGEEYRSSIDLAIAQWMRSPRAASVARERLRELGVTEAEIERRRRCKSDNRNLDGILHIAIKLVITRGQLEKRDLRSLPPVASAPMLREIARATSQAFYNVLIAESVEQTPYVAINMEIGDY